MSETTEPTTVGHCRRDTTDVYVGRGQNGRHMLSTPLHARGWLGNPFTVADYDRAESIEKFLEAFEDKLNRDEAFREAVAELSGQVLGCWCQSINDDQPACHAEVIAEHADRLAKDQGAT